MTMLGTNIYDQEQLKCVKTIVELLNSLSVCNYFLFKWLFEVFATCQKRLLIISINKINVICPAIRRIPYYIINTFLVKRVLYCTLVIFHWGSKMAPTRLSIGPKTLSMFQGFFNPLSCFTLSFLYSSLFWSCFLNCFYMVVMVVGGLCWRSHG